MVKIVVMVAAGAVLAGSVTLLRAMSPIDPAAAALAYGKADRLDIRSYGPGCDERGWPYYEATCLRSVDNGEVKRVRVVTADRLPEDIRFAGSR